jgi:hypothetical protein
VRIPLTLANILARFPDKRPDSINNVDLRELLSEIPENLAHASRIVGTEITRSNLMRECLKREGKYARILSLPEDVPPYEPSLESVVVRLDTDDSVISLPHANVSFTTIEEMHTRIGKLVDIGLSAIEISVQAPKEWIEAILRIRARYDLLLTFGSDSHGLGRIDRYHGEFATLNPHLSAYPEKLEYWKEKFLDRTYGSSYRSMMSGDFS